MNFRWNILENKTILELGNHRSVMDLEKVDSWINEILFEDMQFLDYIFYKYENSFISYYFEGYFIDKFEVYIFLKIYLF